MFNPAKTGLLPRLAAFHALLNWKKGLGFVQDNLQKTCESLPQNDRALAYEIALGTCRNLEDLDAKLKSLMRTLPEEPCRAILEISLYQLLFTRIPPYAVVNSAAELARQMNSNVKFVNAVLRNALRKNFAKAESKVPPQWIRINLQKTSVEELGLQDAKILFGKYAQIPNAGEFLKNPLFQKGYYSFQNPASFFVEKMCEIKPEYKIWDACAAPGGKTAMLAEANPDAFFVSTDNSTKRIAKLFDLQKRLGLNNVHIALADAQKPPFSECFDIVVVDTPCSNMGVVSRRPEAVHRENPELPKKQLAILQGAATAVKKGGILIYCVCSQEKEETQHIIENFALEDSIYTDMPDMDGFYVAKFRKT